MNTLRERFIDAMPTVSSLFTIVTTANLYLTSLKGLEFEEVPKIISPTDLLTSSIAQSVCVSRLTIGEDRTSHFLVSNLSKMSLETLHGALETYETRVLRKKVRSELCVYFRSRFLKCKTRIVEKLSLLRFKWPQREMELRYAIVDPIMEMLCELWDLKVRCMSNTSAF